MSKTAEKLAYRWLMEQVGPARKWLVISVASGLSGGLLFIGFAALLAHIIHSIVVDSIAVYRLWMPFTGALLIMVLRAVCQWGRELSGFRAGMAVRETIRSAMFDKLSKMDPVQVTARPAGSWSTLLVEQVEDIHDFIARYLPQMALAVLVPVAILIAVFPVNWTAGLVFLITAPLIPLFMALAGIKAAEANRKNFLALSRLGGFFLDRLKGMETLRLFQRGQHEQELLDHASENFRITTMRVLKLAFLSSTILEFFASVSIAVLAVYLGMSFLGYLDFGSYGVKVSLFTALFLLLLAPEFYQPLRDLGNYYHARAKAVAAAGLIMELLEFDIPEVQQGTEVVELDGPVSLLANQLTVIDDQSKRQLLSDLSFSIRPGQRVAIIGASGAGKTTLLNVLMGFRPWQGSLMVNQQALAEVDGQQWRRQLAWLGQQPLIIHGSVYDNVAFGRELSREQVLVALEKAYAMDILEKLPEGLDSPLLEQGGNLSVGQAQRIALARAIAKPVRLLLLDEPTASLDQDSEQQVLAALADISRECTLITVTHRLHQITEMDQVLLLEKGRLVAAGNPEELLVQSEVYRQFMGDLAGSLDNA